MPGCSSFLSRADFPYAKAEVDRYAGLMPEQYASEDTAIDLACSAYMRATADDIRVGGVEPVALALTGSVTSVKAHRGDHRVHIVCMTRDRILGRTVVLEKRDGPSARAEDGRLADLYALAVLLAALNPEHEYNAICDDFTAKATERFFQNPVFRAPYGERAPASASGWRPIFPGAFDPPHEGHEGIANAVANMGLGEPVFTICTDAPNKPALSLQEMLTRAQKLRHRQVLFTRGDPLYVDKARSVPGRPLVIGADALLRMLDPRWGADPKEVFQEFQRLNTTLLVFGREINGTFVSAREAIDKVPADYLGIRSMGVRSEAVLRPIEGRWDVSSTAVRAHAQVCHG